MYGIFTTIYPRSDPNVGEPLHGACGNVDLHTSAYICNMLDWNLSLSILRGSKNLCGEALNHAKPPKMIPTWLKSNVF